MSRRSDRIDQDRNNVSRAEPVADNASPAPEQARADFCRDGVLGPIRLFTQAQCDIIVETLGREGRPAPAEWSKGRAVTDHFFYELATRPALLALVRSLIGDDVVLWGARTIERRPGQTHVWHSDIESCAPEGGFVSAWIGIENTSQDSALHVITRSHLCGKSVQQVLHERGLRRGEPSAEDLLALAREIAPGAELQRPAMTNGEMLLYDGRLWHGSHNAQAEGKRLALLLQYAAADVPVHMPDFKQLEWPFRFLQTPRPPVIRVSGTGGNAANRVVPAPPLDLEEPALLSSTTRPVPLPLAEDPEKGFKSHRILRGRSTIVDFLNCHMSTLSGGRSPHRPHAHAEEELLIILDGEAELVISDSRSTEGARIEPVRPGAFVYYPPFQHHTIRNPGTAPVTYLMFKWRAGATAAAETLPTRVFRYDDLTPEAGKGLWTGRLIRDATPYLARLGCHLSVLQPQKGYRPHADAYDVAILLLSGELETLGERVSAPRIIFYAAGEPHGLRNVGDQPARYLVFEFHAPPERSVLPKSEVVEPTRDPPTNAETGPAPKAVARPARAGVVRRLRRSVRGLRKSVRGLRRSGRRALRWLGLRGTRIARKSDDPRVGALVRQARALAAAADFEGALALCREVPPDIREHARITAERNRVLKRIHLHHKRTAHALADEIRQLRRRGNVARGLAVYEAAAAPVREQPLLLYEYARLLQKALRFGDAYDAFGKLLKADVSRRHVWLHAGTCLVRLGRRAELARLIQDMLDALPPNAEILMQASSLARNGELHALAARLCERAMSRAETPSPASIVQAARILLRQGEQGRVISLLSRHDAHLEPNCADQAADLLGLARAQLRLAGRRDECGPVRDGERADLIAVETILQHAGEARACYRPVEGGIAIVLSSLGPGGIQTQVVRLVSGLRAQGRAGPIAVLVVTRTQSQPEFHRNALLTRDVTIECIADFGLRSADLVPPDIAGTISVLPAVMVPRIAYLIDRLRAHRPSAVLAMADAVGFPTMLAGAIVGVPRMAVSVRSEPPLAGSARDRLFKPAFQAALTRDLIALSANSWATARNVAAWLDQPPDRVRAIHNGVDVDQLLAQRDPAATAAHRRALGIPDGARVVGSVFAYRRAKRPDLWIEAAALIARRAPDVVFIIVGGGFKFNDFTTRLQHLGLSDRFHRPGTRTDVATWIDLMDVFLMTAELEGTANALLEAQALGRPVVATAVGGNAETLLPDQTGILLAANPTAEEIADAVMRVLDDPAFAARAREQAPQFIRQRFHVDRMVSEFVDLCFGDDAAHTASDGRRPG
jgi:glycosyltransferase involved in cell wall biosynthesis/mannose-6-phosphate isomerase-like protein (cupin superfamily)/tetratricopeptide (TPR) repeat protein